MEGALNTFLATHSDAANWLEAASNCLAQIPAIPATANLGFLYASDEFAQNLPNILNYFKDATRIEHWVGTVGVGICASGKEYHEKPALSIMLGAFPEGSFRVFGTIQSDFTAFLADHKAWFEKTESRFGIVHGDPRNHQLAELITRLSTTIGDGFLVGGLTSTRGLYAQVAEGVTQGGLSGVLFSPEVAVATTLTQSCARFGKVYEITGCEQNIITSLDRRPALDVFYEEIGEVLSRDLNRAARYIGAALPVPGSDIGDYLVRNVVGIDPDQKLLAIGELLNVGQTLQFCRRDAENAHKDLQRVLRELKARLPHPPKGGVYYSCVGRGQHMFGDNSEELKTIQQEFGDLPLSGFFCNGEISYNRLYGYTGVLSLFL